MQRIVKGKEWSGRLDLNLSRYAGVSEAGACRRNPERREGPLGPGIQRILKGKEWSGRLDLNLSRYAGVSEAGACRRNPERREGPLGPGIQRILKGKQWSGRLDLNQRPPAPKAGALPGCATPRHTTTYAIITLFESYRQVRLPRKLLASGRSAIPARRRPAAAKSCISLLFDVI
jgi:hypothetical protein